MQIVNISDAIATFSKLIERVSQGEEIVIGKAGKPVARIVPFERDITPRDLSQGVWEGQVWMSDDFDELLTSFSGMDDDEASP